MRSESRLIVIEIMKAGLEAGEVVNVPDEKKDREPGGGVNIGSGSHISIGGDVVGRDKIVTTTIPHGIGTGELAELMRQFALINQRIEARPADPNVDKAELSNSWPRRRARAVRVSQEIGMARTVNRAQTIAHAEAAPGIYEQIEDPTAAGVRKKLAEWRGRE